MATIINRKRDAKHVSTYEYYGTSMDVKPTIAGGETDIADYSMYLELDTGDVYYYIADTDSWDVLGG